MAHILIIEDDPVLGPRLQRNLDLSGYRTTLAREGRSGLDTAENGAADLIVLDLMLPLIDGLKVLRTIRHDHIDTPVIILTAKGTETDRLDGFRTGCDDYVTKPFSLDELLARIKAVLRRTGYREIQHVLRVGGITMDPQSRIVSCGCHPIDLSPKEFELLYTLVSQPNRALSRYYLLDTVWGEETDVTIRTVDAHIAYLRRKIEVNRCDGHIETVYKVGYMWCVKT